MTETQRTNALESAYQLKRDFKFHLAQELDIVDLIRLIEKGNQAMITTELERLALLYATQIKLQANSNYC